MKHFKTILAALAVALVTAPAIGQKTHGYTNPVIPGFYPDPSVCRVGDDFYLVNSSFQFFPGVPIFHSKDLIHWEQIGNVLDRESQLPLKNASAWLGIYAPTIRYNDGTFYMVTTNVGNGNGDKGNFFVTATDPRGPWSDPVWLDQGAIDPSFYFEDGRCFMTSNPNDAIWLCEIDPKTGKQLSPSREIWRGTGGRYPEGPHIYKKDGYYYLLISEGGTEMGHKVTVARSKSIYGPYEGNPDNPILTHQKQAAQNNPIQGTGHADLVEAPDGSWWMVCLAFRPQTNNMHLTGRETYLTPVTWNAQGWPVVNGEGTIHLDMDVATLPQAPDVSRDVLYNFTTMDRLGPQWIYLRNPDMGNYSLSSKGLQLKGTEIDLDNMGSPTFVAMRQQDIDFTAETTLHLTKDSQSSAEAGMTIYVDTSSHYDFFITDCPDGQQTIVLRYRLNSITGTLDSRQAIVPGTEVTLRVAGSADRYDFSCIVDGKETRLGALDTRYLSTETAGGFTGVTLGLYATGDGTGVFRDFRYHPGPESTF